MQHGDIFMTSISQWEVYGFTVALALFGVNSLLRVLALDLFETFKAVKEKCFDTKVCKLKGERG